MFTHITNRYTRNLVDAGNGKFNLMLICWGEGHGSAIHDHADAHCFMKMLKGELSEIRYAWPSDNQNNIDEQNHGDIGENEDHDVEYDGEELQELSRSSMETNGVAYINGIFKKKCTINMNVYILQNYLFRYPWTSSC